MKKIIAIALCLSVLIGMFVGCKKTNNNSSTPNSTPSAVSSETGNQTSKVENTTSQNSSSQTASGNSSVSSATNNNSSAQSSASSSSSSKNSSTNKTSSTASSSKPISTEMPTALKTLKGIEKYKNEPVNYSGTSNWISKPANPTKDVDVFFLYPTGYTGTSGDLSDINDSSMLYLANQSKLGQASVFAKSCNIYMPKYRQFSVNALVKYGNEENLIYCASFDLYSALDHYFENCNNGRPFIIAGHSQGSVWASVILQDYMKKHPEYLKRMVAAYVIGYSITKDFLKKNTHLKFATGATDTGVIVSYNTEGPQNTNNIVVLDGAVAINPINWKTDETYASESENLGSLNNDTLEITSPGLADARLDLKRGVIITTAEKNGYPYNKAFGEKGYHSQDFALFYENLRQNVADRIKAYLK